MRKLLLTLCLLTASCHASDRMYIDINELDSTQNAFHIHTGENKWIKTKTVHHDETGLYTYECDISSLRDGKKMAYEQTWKCPYCFRHYKMTEGCDNANCPSRLPKR